MNKVGLKIKLLALLSFCSPVLANDTAEQTKHDTQYSFKIGFDAWDLKTKVNESTRDILTTSAFSGDFKNTLKYAPHIAVRYVEVNGVYMGFNKLDTVIYYPVLNKKVLKFDLGIMLSNLSNTQYKDSATGIVSNFDGLISGLYGNAIISIPHTPFDLVSEVAFGDTDGVKHVDLVAAVQVKMPVYGSEIALKAGYRVIDLQSQQFNSLLGKPYALINGAFMGVHYTF